MSARFVIASLIVAASGCARRSVLRMEPLPPTYAWQAPTTPGTAAPAATGPRTGTGMGDTAAPTATGVFAISGARWADLPAPHLAPRSKLPVPTPTTIEAARALIGWRDPRTSQAFALAVATQLGRAGALPDLADGPALVAWAARHDALARITPGAADPPPIAPGDLLVFDRAVADKPASLVAVALGRDARGVVELLYLAGGVIRRGHVDPTRPTTSRDRERRVVNTFLRHGADQPPAGTRFRTGELLSARIRLPRR
jgi:hypothetical protein